MGRKKKKPIPDPIVRNSHPEDPDEPGGPEDDDEEDQDGEEPEINSPGKTFGQKFSEWMGNLSDTVQKIYLYVYKLENVGNGIPKKVQAYAFQIARDADPPESHDIGVIVGSGTFDIVARTRGKEIFRKQVTFGPVYDDLRDERKQELKAAALQAENRSAPPGQMIQQAAPDPFAALGNLVKTLQPILAPFMAGLAGQFNPMENIRRMSAMGEEMAQQAFDFKLKAGARAAREAYAGDDDEPVNGPPPVSASTRSGWEDKLSDLADLLMWKGKEFLSARGEKAESMANTVNRKVLNDSAFQTLLQNPEEFKVAYAKLCKDCAKIGGAETVGAILKKLGINPPVLLKAAAPVQTSGNRKPARA